MKHRIEIALATLTIVFTSAAFASVTVTQNIAPGVTSWPDTPLIQTVSNPSSQLVVGESFGAATNISETFTVPGPNNYSLETINL